jgi:anti-anti-sigma regulatory factor
MTKKKSPRIKLAPRLTIAQAADLHRTLAARLESGGPIIVDGTHVEEIDTAILQLLTSLWRTGRERSVACTWYGVSDALCRTATLIGVAEILQIPGGGAQPGNAS